MDYKKLLVETYHKQQNYFTSKMMDHQKAAESEIDFFSFFVGCNVAIEDLLVRLENERVKKHKHLMEEILVAKNNGSKALQQYIKEQIEYYSQDKSKEDITLPMADFTNNEINEKLYFSQIREMKYKLDIAETKAFELRDRNAENNSVLNIEFYPNVFKIKENQDKFLTLMEKVDLDKSNSRLADISFIYRKMQKDSFIRIECTAGVFIKFFFDAYEIDLGTKIKTKYELRGTWADRVKKYNHVLNINQT